MKLITPPQSLCNIILLDHLFLNKQKNTNKMKQNHPIAMAKKQGLSMLSRMANAWAQEILLPWTPPSSWLALLQSL